MVFAADEEQPVRGQIFGASENSLDVEEVDGFIAKEPFFEKYLRPSKPVKFKKAFVDSDAYNKWTDEYFLEEVYTEMHPRVLIETQKKEDRNQSTLMMDFHEFVRNYNTSEYYMVEDIPQFLA